MYVFISCHMAVLTERHITHITGIRMFTTMYVFPSCQMALLIEYLITH